MIVSVVVVELCESGPWTTSAIQKVTYLSSRSVIPLDISSGGSIYKVCSWMRLIYIIYKTFANLQLQLQKQRDAV